MTFAAHELEEERIAAEIARTNQEREPLEVDADYDAMAGVRAWQTTRAEMSAVAEPDVVPGWTESEWSNAEYHNTARRGLR